MRSAPVAGSPPRCILRLRSDAPTRAATESRPSNGRTTRTSTPDAEGPGVTFRSARHPGNSCTRSTWFPGKVISERQARRVFNKLCGLPDCRCRHFAASGASLEEVRDSVPGLGRQFVVLPAQQKQEKTRRFGVAKGAAAPSVDQGQ